MPTISRRSALLLLGSACVCGCQNSGPDANGGPAKGVLAGLNGQTCAGFVWADLSVQHEFPTIRLDLAKLLVSRLETKPAAGSDPKDTAQTITFVEPARVVRYQMDHRETDWQPITAIAPHLQVTRVLHVEIEQLSAQAARSIMLLKGTGTATLRVLEVANGSAQVVLEERGISVEYPPNSPAGVMPSEAVNVRTIYEGTLKELADELVATLADH
jgi:hypothetical protein